MILLKVASAARKGADARIVPRFQYWSTQVGVFAKEADLTLYGKLSSSICVRRPPLKNLIFSFVAGCMKGETTFQRPQKMKGAFKNQSSDKDSGNCCCNTSKTVCSALVSRLRKPRPTNGGWIKNNHFQFSGCHLTEQGRKSLVAFLKLWIVDKLYTALPGFTLYLGRQADQEALLQPQVISQRHSI